MSTFCEYAIGEVAETHFTARTTSVLSRLGDSLVLMILDGLEDTSCSSCRRIRSKIDAQSRTILRSSIRMLFSDAASEFTPWLCNHLREEFTSCNRGF